MKKIMFNDRYGLTEAVFSGRKTQTRRICKEQHWSFSDLVNANENDSFLFEQPKYRIGEIVAVAQSYSDFMEAYKVLYRTVKEVDGYRRELASEQKGWNNKLFVCADLMPHSIRITDVRVERLQDISDEDCIKEGIETMESYVMRVDGTKKTLSYYRIAYRCKSGRVLTLSGSTPREVYHALIDRICGKGTWDSNPYVFVYDFELIK